jgi:hypothetical protein
VFRNNNTQIIEERKMKNLRTLVTLLFTGIVVLALAIGCAKKEEAPATQTEEPAATETMAADTTATMDSTMAAPAEQPQ